MNKKVKISLVNANTGEILFNRELSRADLCPDGRCIVNGRGALSRTVLHRDLDMFFDFIANDLDGFRIELVVSRCDAVEQYIFG